MNRSADTSADIADWADPLDVITCDGCSRSFVTQDGPGMIAVIKGACPGCGGRFQLAGTAGAPHSAGARPRPPRARVTAESSASRGEEERRSFAQSPPSPRPPSS